jgi:hypothetical protein
MVETLVYIWLFCQDLNSISKIINVYTLLFVIAVVMIQLPLQTTDDIENCDYLLQRKPEAAKQLVS